MVEAGYTLEQIQIKRVLDGTASCKECKAVAANLAQLGISERVLFALNQIARCEAKIYACRWGAGDSSAYLGIKSPLSPEQLRERLCNAFGTSQEIPVKGEQPFYAFANGLQFQITRRDGQTIATIYAPFGFAPFEP